MKLKNINSSDLFLFSSRWNNADLKKINYIKNSKKEKIIFSNIPEFIFGSSHSLLDLYIVKKNKLPDKMDKKKIRRKKCLKR